jgi:AbiTii
MERIGKYDLASLLRKCRILAQRLNNADLKSWVVNELEEYRAEDDLPDYRLLSQALLLGHYFGSFGAEARNVQIPTSAFLEEFRESIIGLRVTQGNR